MNLLFIIPLIIFAVFSLSASLTLCFGYRNYHRVYKTLKYRKFYRNNNQIYSHNFYGNDDGFVWFTEDNSFKLVGSTYLHNSMFTYFDLYSFFWMIKYRNWFKKNVDLNCVEKY